MRDEVVETKPLASSAVGSQGTVTTYATVMADPPWQYDEPGEFVKPRSDLNRASASARYPTMPLPEICALPVRNLVGKNAHLYLWATNAFMDEAHDVARAWGFTPKTILTWVKTHVDNPARPSMKMGYYYRSATEHCLFCVRGSLALRGPAAPTAFLHPRLPHSVKPARFFDLVEEQSPGPYVEIFARRSRPGWDAWGNEVAPSVDLAEVEQIESTVLGVNERQGSLFGASA